MRYLRLALVLGLVALVAAAAGSWRGGALPGAAASVATGVASLALMLRVSRARKPVQASLAVMALMFLVRLLAVAVCAVLVARSGASVLGFLVAFFVPYFLYIAIEGAYLASLARPTRTPA